MIKRFLFDVANRDAGHVLYVSNLDEVLADLKLIDPQARKAFNTDTRKILKPYVAIAQDFIPAESPLSQWRTVVPTYTSAGWENDRQHRGRDAHVRWRWDGAEARQGIRITRGSHRSRTLTFDNVVGLMNRSISGKMFELIGQGKKRNDSRFAARNPNAGQLMRDNMNRKHGHRKRVVWKILEDHGAQIGTKMEQIIDPILARFGRER
jgi:hypothetical protein